MDDGAVRGSRALIALPEVADAHIEGCYEVRSAMRPSGGHQALPEIQSTELLIRS